MNKDDDASDINDDAGAEEEPLNSEDDVTDEDNADLFDTENVVVCQYDKVRALQSPESSCALNLSFYFRLTGLAISGNFT